MEIQPLPDTTPSRAEIDYRALFEQSALGMGYIRLGDAHWVEVNNAFCQMLWRSRNEMLSVPWLSLVHPDDVDVYVNLVERLMTGETASHVAETRLLHTKGHFVWARLAFSVVRDPQGKAGYANVIIEDVSKRKATEHELGDSRVALEVERKKLQVVLDTIPTGFIMLDEYGAMVIENSEWKRTWGGNALVNGIVDYEKYKGFRPDTGERLSKEEWPCAVSLMQGIETRDVILDIERFNGTRGTIVVSSAPIRDESGRVIAAVAANMDISELRAAQTKLIEADQRKDEFLAMLAHELRNPLAPISAASEMLRLVAHGDLKVNKASEVISRQTKHLATLVDDLLDVSRVTRGLIDLDKQVIDLTSVIAGASEQSRPLFESKKQTFSVEGNVSFSVILGDANRLIQVFTNLLNNASKYTAHAGHIKLIMGAREDIVFVEVEDDGIGIEPALLPHIFDLFSQATRTSDRSQGGLGIGLALVKTIVVLHGGEIAAESSGLGAGSRFIVTLPRANNT